MIEDRNGTEMKNENRTKTEILKMETEQERNGNGIETKDETKLYPWQLFAMDKGRVYTHTHIYMILL